VQAPAGSFIAAAPGLVHSFRNEGPARARFLNFHAPSERFHDYLRASYAGEDTSWFDQYDAPADGGRPLSDAVVTGPGERKRIEVAGMLLLAETTFEPGFAGSPRDETNRRVFDLLYVLEGTLSLREDGDVTEAPPGTFALFPPGVDHTVENRSGGPVRALNVQAPAG
jgi:mannose-6-phosphate isomerase-like protein (cupin superfamily)